MIQHPFQPGYSEADGLQQVEVALGRYPPLTHTAGAVDAAEVATSPAQGTHMLHPEAAYLVQLLGLLDDFGAAHSGEASGGYRSPR